MILSNVELTSMYIVLDICVDHEINTYTVIKCELSQANRNYRTIG
jgi:hypothetical protein